MISNEASVVSSGMGSGSIRWMSPELIDPGSFGLAGNRPTKESDCYALGMVIYEVLSGRAPFDQLKDFVVMRRIIDGSRPERPQGEEGAWFTDPLWKTVELCWTPEPRDRISAKTILLGLEGSTPSLEPISLRADGDVEADADDRLDEDSSMFSQFHPRPTLTYPYGITGLLVTHDSEQYPDQLQTGNPKEGGVSKGLVHRTREIFRMTIRKLYPF